MQSGLWIMRHAHTEPTNDATKDADRPLTKEGVMQAEVAGEALKRLKAPIQNLLSGTTKRTCQTAELVGKPLGLTPKTDERLDGSPVQIHEVTQGLGNCLVVTHEPSCSLIIYRLTGAQTRLSRGGLCQIHEGEVWAMLNPSTCRVMAGLDIQGDPQSYDDRSLETIRIPPLERIAAQPERLMRAWAL